MLPVIAGVAPNLAHFSQGCVFEPRCSDRMETCQTREPATVAVSERHGAACLKLGE
jgi:oligopeptide/dipeptide ABC transporter ATP-binding protein